MVHFMQAGQYQFINAKVNFQDKGEFLAGSFASIKATGNPEWIKPDGTREPIPTIYLYAPWK